MPENGRKEKPSFGLFESRPSLLSGSSKGIPPDQVLLPASQSRFPRVNGDWVAGCSVRPDLQSTVPSLLRNSETIHISHYYIFLCCRLPENKRTCPCMVGYEVHSFI